MVRLKILKHTYERTNEYNSEFCGLGTTAYAKLSFLDRYTWYRLPAVSMKSRNIRKRFFLPNALHRTNKLLWDFFANADGVDTYMPLVNYIDRPPTCSICVPSIETKVGRLDCGQEFCIFEFGTRFGGERVQSACIIRFLGNERSLQRVLADRNRCTSC